MGKSSLMVMLTLASLAGLATPKIRVTLKKIGAKTLDQLAEEPEPGNTVVLLDALDEDAEAWDGFYKRLCAILRASQHFRKVIITCRTQFFPQEHEEDGRVPGVITICGFHCAKLFLSPFSDPQVVAYLERRFDEVETREKAARVVSTMKSLKFRPMLLSYVDLLLDASLASDDTFSVYELLVEEWFNRELRKGHIKDKASLRDACFILAKHMYATRTQALSRAQVKDLCKTLEWFRNFEYMTIEGRSLLHRNSFGDYKFAHLSIMEYFVAAALSETPNAIANTDQVISFISDLMSRRGLRSWPHVDLHGLHVSDTDLNGASFSTARLAWAKFSSTVLEKARFDNAELQHTSFFRCDLRNTSFVTTRFDKTEFDACDLTDARLIGVYLGSSSIRDTRLCGIKMHHANGEDANLSGIDFSRAHLQVLKFRGARLAHTRWTDAVLERVDLSEAILAESSWMGARLVDSLLENADCAGARFHRARFQTADFSGAQLTNATFHRTEAVGLVLARSTLVHTDFSEAMLSGVTIADTSVEHVKFVRADCPKMIVRDALMMQTSFERAALDGAVFERVRLIKTSFLGASIANTRWVGCELTGCSFSAAQMEGARFEDCVVVDSVWTGARYDDRTILPDGLDPKAAGMTMERD